MKRFVISVIIFALLCILGYLAYLFIWGAIPKTREQDFVLRDSRFTYRPQSGFVHLMLREANEFKDLDILFVGSSHAYGGFDVRVFEKYGFRTFVLGIAGLDPIVAQELLNRYLGSLNPKLVIYEISPERFRNSSRAAEVLIDNDNLNIQSLKMALRMNRIEVYNALLYRSMRELLKLDSNMLQPPRVKENRDGTRSTYISGFIEANANAHFNGAEEKYQRTKINLSPRQLNTFKEITSGFKDRKTKYILVFTPFSKVYYNHYENIDEFDSLMRQYGEYYNFNKILNLSDSCFRDATHLLPAGAEIFSAKVAGLIDSLGIISRPD
jgi:hypothetical protein